MNYTDTHLKACKLQNYYFTGTQKNLASKEHLCLCRCSHLKLFANLRRQAVFRAQVHGYISNRNH